LEGSLKKFSWQRRENRLHHHPDPQGKFRTPDWDYALWPKAQRASDEVPTIYRAYEE